MLSRSQVLVASGILCLVTCLVPVGTALAGGLPASGLVAEHQHQRGGLVWEEWTDGNRHSCVAQSGDGTGAYPRPLAISPGPHLAHFVLGRAERPNRIRIVAYRSADQADPGMKLPYELRPRLNRVGAITAWRVYFRVTPPPNYYLDLYAKWPAHAFCGGPRHFLRTYSVKSG